MPRSLEQSARLEVWATSDSLLHRRDARGKIVAAILLLISIGSTPPPAAPRMAAFFVALAAGLAISRVPVSAALLRAAIILPFTALFAAISWWVNQDWLFAATLVCRSYLSALGVVLLMATTPLPQLLRGLQGLRMRRAALSRSGSGRTSAARKSLLQRAGGALAVLFGRSYAHAEGVHRAMVARGFRGEFRGLRPARFLAADWSLIAVTAFLCVGAVVWIP